METDTDTDFDPSLEFGTPNYDGERVTREFVNERRLKAPEKGELQSVYIARVVPPVKSQKPKGQYLPRYCRKHFGTKRKSKRTGNLYMATYLCLEIKTKEGKILRECPKCNDIRTKERDLKLSETQWKQAGKTDEEVKALSKPLSEWFQKHNVDTKYNINVMTQDGVFERLALTKKGKTALEIQIAQLRKDGVDPLDPKGGVWFKFMRAGFGKDVVDTVEPLKEFHNVPGIGKAEVLKPAPMSVEQMRKALEICPDLDPEKGEVVTVLTSDQILALVQGSEDPDFVESVFTGAQHVESSKEEAPAASVKTKVAKTEAPSGKTEELDDSFWNRVENS